jgi:hypothetical protein
MRRWKLSPMDLESRAAGSSTRAARTRCSATRTSSTRLWVVEADDKRRARLNCIAHLLSLVDYADLTPPPIELPPRQEHEEYIRPPMEEQRFVPQAY